MREKSSAKICKNEIIVVPLYAFSRHGAQRKAKTQFLTAELGSARGA